MNDLAIETRRLNQQVWRMLWHSGSLAAEIPLRIHSADIDPGGSPEFHPRFLAYLRDSGACFCDEFDADGNPRPHTCDRRFEDKPARFRGSRGEAHPRRLKRALRQLRLIAPYDQYHLVFLMVSRGWEWTQARDHVNSNRAARLEAPLSDTDTVVMMIAGFDMLTAAW